jgi:hypothetical protein
MLALNFPAVKFVSVVVAIEAAPLDAKIVYRDLQALAFFVLFPRMRANRTCRVVLAIGVFG